MKKIFKKIGLFSFGILAAIGFTACKSKTTKKDTTDKPTTKVTTTANKTSGEDKQDTYTVSGQSMDGVVVKVYTVVNAEKTEITDFTKAIEKGTKLYFSITNSSTKTIKVSLTLGGTAYKSVVVNAGENGEIIGAELTNNIVYSVTETTVVETATLTVSVDHSHDTATEINSVHVYDPTDPDHSEKASGSDIEIGSQLKVYVWNVATNVHLKITNGTTVEADKDYPKLREDQIGPGNYGHDEYFTFTVTGDVKVEVTYIEEVTEKYSVTLNNTFTDLTVNMSYVDEDMNLIPVNSGDEVPYNTVLYVQMINDDTENGYVAYAEVGGTISNSGKVENGPDAFGGINGILVTGNVVIKTVELTPITVTFNKMTGVDVVVTDLSDFEPRILDSGDTTFKYCYVSVEVKNTLVDPVILTLTYMGQTMGMTIPAGQEFSDEIFAMSSATFVVEEYQEFDCEIDLGDYALTPYIMYMTQDSTDPVYLENGDKVAKATPVMIMIINQEETKILILTIKNGDTVVYNGVLPQYYMLDDEYITITGKLVITVAEAIMPDDSVDVYLDNDIADATVKLEFENEDGETVTVNTFSATIPADVEVTITITNNSAVDIMVTITCDGYDNVMTIVSGDNDDCTITSSTDITIKIEENNEEEDDIFIYVENDYEDLELEISYIDEDSESYLITDFDVPYEAGLIISVSINNYYTDKLFKVYAVMDGTIIRTTNIDAFGMGNLTSFSLTSSVSIVVEEINEIIETASIVIYDDRESTETLKNIVKLYDADNNEYEDGDEVEIGTVLYLEIYNYASDATLTFRNDSEEDEGIPSSFLKLDSPNFYGPYSFEVAGQIYIDLVEATPEDDDEYTITIDNDYSSKVSICAYYVNEDDEDVTVTTFPATLPEDIEVTIEVTNNDDTYKYIATLVIDGEVIKTIVVKQGDNDSFIVTLQANITVNIEKITNTEGYTITVDNEFEELYIKVSYVDENGEELEVTNYNNKYEAGLAITISADNYYETYLFKVSAIIDGEVIDYADVSQYGYSYFEMNLLGDLTIVVEKTGEYVEDNDRDVTITTIENVSVTVRVDEEDLKDEEGMIYNGDTVYLNTIVNISITNNTSKPVYIDIRVDGYSEVSKALLAGDAYNYDGFEVYGDLDITVSELNSIHINYGSNVDDVTITAYNLEEGINEAGVIAHGDVVDGGTLIGFVVTNNSENDVYVYAWNGSFTIDGELDYFCAVVPAGLTYTYDGEDILAFWDFGLYVTVSTVEINYDLGEYENVSFELSYTLLSGDEHDINNGDDLPYGAPIDGIITNNETVDLVIEVYFDDWENPWSYFTLVAGETAYLSEKLNCTPEARNEKITFKVVYPEN